MKNLLRFFFLAMLVLSCSQAKDNDKTTESKPPNIIIILADDMGYGDLGCQGHPLIKTPNIDRLAAEGQRWTSFYASHFACNPSRASLLTGRLHYRIHKGEELWANLPSSENTIAEMLKTKNYATACIGKWHLGMNEGEHPLDQGFDYYYGLAGSNDAPINKETGFTRTYENVKNAKFDDFDIDLFHQKKVIEDIVRQDLLTQRYTTEAVKWIQEHGNNPFFLYLPHSMPHVPIFASEEFKGQSKGGLYGDVIEELDWSVGEIIKALKETGITQNTLVVFTSDNGPWLTYYDLGGSSGHLRDGKLTAWEGGYRVPGIFWWPGTISPSIIDDMAGNVDLMSTISSLVGFAMPNDRTYDSYDLSPTLLTGASAGRNEWFYYGTNELWGARVGNYKLHFQSRESVGTEEEGQWRGYGNSVVYESPVLYDLSTDISERFNRAEENPEVVKAIEEVVRKHKESISR
jgi:arylsulfatase A